jgi:hypothetical protein
MLNPECSMESFGRIISLGVPGFDGEVRGAVRRRACCQARKSWQQLESAKNSTGGVASPYFKANNFAFAYA